MIRGSLIWGDGGQKNGLTCGSGSLCPGRVRKTDQPGLDASTAIWPPASEQKTARLEALDGKSHQDGEEMVKRQTVLPLISFCSVCCSCLSCSVRLFVLWTWESNGTCMRRSQVYQSLEGKTVWEMTSAEVNDCWLEDRGLFVWGNALFFSLFFFLLILNGLHACFLQSS